MLLWETKCRELENRENDTGQTIISLPVCLQLLKYIQKRFTFNDHKDKLPLKS